MEVRAGQVTLDMVDDRSKRRYRATLWAVLAREVNAPSDKHAIEWLLLTTYPVHTFEDAKLVIRGYAQRWRIEKFHRIWKTGACNVEDTQLRQVEHIERWATILASVAIRILRLTYLARTQPTLPATVELTHHEIDAIIALNKPKGYRRGQIPTIADAVFWLAQVGSYTGRSSGGPPGAIVIARGLKRIEPLAEYFAEKK